MSDPVRATPPRYRIERAEEGYRVVGDGVLVWEPTLSEAVERREELESGGAGRWAYPLQPPVAAEPEEPPRRILYGPVQSRRFGRSLGINLTPPGCRVCTYSCVYCEFVAEPEEARGGHWPTPGEVGSALANALPRCGDLDSITISGHGEPTQHPHFARVVADILAARGTRHELPIRILTNGTQAVRPLVRRALDLLDERIVTLDADAERVNRPSGDRSLEASLEAASRLRDVTIQSCFVDGSVSNVGSEAVSRWADLAAALRPRAAHLYSINRPPGIDGIRPVGRAQLEEIACVLRERAGVEAQVYD